MVRKILFATDCSESARAALEVAAVFARKFDARIHAVHVTPLHEPDPEQSEKRLAEAVPAAFDDVVDERRLVRAVSPELGIIHEARDTHCDLIAVGTHGLTGLKHVLLGSVAERVVQLAPCSVLTHRAGDVTFERILCPVDFSKLSNDLLERAGAAARAFGAELLAVHVIEPILYPVEYGMAPVPAGDLESKVSQTALERLEELVAESAGGETRTRCKVVLGRAESRIVDLVEEENADLIVMSTHGLTGIKHAFLGSVAERVVRQASCPVLIVKSETGAR